MKKHARILSLLLSVVMMLGMIVPTMATEEETPLPTVTIALNEQSDATLAVFDVKLENNTGFFGFSWDVIHSDDLVFNKINLMEDEETEDYFITQGLVEAKDKNIAYAHTKNYKKNGTLFQIIFNVNAGVTVADEWVDLQVNNIDYYVNVETGEKAPLEIKVVPYGTKPTVDPDDPTAPPVNPDDPTVPPVEPDDPTVPPVNPDDPTTPDVPTTPDEPTTPDVPTTPDEPTTPDVPTTPDEPTTPDVPTTPDEPTTPDVPTTPDEPEVPEIDVTITEDEEGNTVIGITLPAEKATDEDAAKEAADDKQVTISDDDDADRYVITVTVTDDKGNKVTLTITLDGGLVDEGKNDEGLVSLADLITLIAAEAEKQGKQVNYNQPIVINNVVAENDPVVEPEVEKQGMIFPKLYKVTVKCGEGGKVNTSKNFVIARGASRTLTITPEEGYEVEDVLINGRSVGAVEKYTIKGARQNYTVAVIFEEIED